MTYIETDRAARARRAAARLGIITPEMNRAYQALCMGPLKRAGAGFVDAAGNPHLFSVVDALKRRGIALVDKYGACLSPEKQYEQSA